MIARRRARVRLSFRPVLAALEDRQLLATTLTGLSAIDARTLGLSYDVGQTGASMLDVLIYRSADATLDPNNDPLIGRVSLTAGDLAPGPHDAVPLPTGALSSGADALGIDPAHPYILVQATDQDGPSNVESLRKYSLALVTHGFVPPNELGQFPAWVPQMASALEAQGYDHAIAFDWSQTAGILLPGLATAAGVKAASDVAQFLQTPGNIPDGAVVDLHFIGHSRGSVVITQALQSLQDQLSSLPQLKGGYDVLTYLDPHPAHATNIVPFTVAPGTLGQVALAAGNLVQNATQDPYPLAVPALAATAEVYSEQTLNSQIVETNAEWVINPQGTMPPGGFNPASPSTVFRVQNLSAPGMTHSQTHAWYSEFVVPTLGTNNAFVTGPIVAPISVSAYQNLKATVDVPLVLNTLVGTLDVTDPSLSQGDFQATIDWGDNSQTTGYVLGTPIIGFGVFGEHIYTRTGTFTYTVTVTNPSNGTSSSATGTFVVSPWSLQARSTGGPTVDLVRSDNGQTVAQIQPFAGGSRGPIGVSSGDVDGDGTPDMILTSGPRVLVLSGVDAHPITRLNVPPMLARGGLNISAGDLNGDGKADLVVTPARAYAAPVAILDGQTGRPIRVYRPFRGLGGLTTSVADVNGDRQLDVVARSSTGAVDVQSGAGLLADRSAATLRQTRRLRAAVAHGMVPLRRAVGLLGLGVVIPGGRPRG